MRGGRVVFQDVPKPTTDDWESAQAAVQAALTLEKKVNQVKSCSSEARKGGSKYN